MLFAPDATYIDQATKQVARIFPTGSSWLSFESRMPPLEVFRDSVLDEGLGTLGELGVSAIANADWQNWTSSIQIATFELATRVGLPVLENQNMGRAVASIFTSLPATIGEIADREDPLSIVPELLQNVGALVVQALMASQNWVVQIIAQVLELAIWVINVVADYRADVLEKSVSLPPLQSIEPATDTWEVNRVLELLRRTGKGEVQYPDGRIKLASNANYTPLFMPTYDQEKPWKIQWRDGGIAAQQGDPQKLGSDRKETKYKFDPGDGTTLGFMPGAGVMLRVLQASHRFYATMRGNPVDRFTLRCRALDRACWRTAKGFDGKRDCRQCVTAESVWPVGGIAWAIGGSVPLNVTTPGENVGAFYASTNKLLASILEMASRPGPLLYTVDWFRVYGAWQKSFEAFWEFARSYWLTFHGWGWRGLISRLATLMVAFEDSKGKLQIGGRMPNIPPSLVASPRDDSNFGVSFDHSIFSRLIAPYCADAVQLQRHYLHTTEVAYVPPGAGALYFDDGRIRKTELGEEFRKARAELLDSTKRMLVDLRRVSDPEYRRELEAKGVKASPVNEALQDSPGVGGGQVLKPDIKPARAPRRPKSILASPLAGGNALARAQPPRASTAPPRASTKSGVSTGAKVALGVTAATALLVSLGGLAAMQRDSDDEA